MREIVRQGMKPGLWIDSGQIGWWTIWDNPAGKNARTSGGGLCRASEAVSRLYLEGYTRQSRRTASGFSSSTTYWIAARKRPTTICPGLFDRKPICNHIIQLYRD